MKHLTDNEIQSCLHESQTEAHARLRRHIARCPQCRNQLLFYQQLGAVVTPALSEDAPKDFEAMVLERLRVIRRHRRVIDLVAVGVGFAGLTLITLISVLSPQLSDVFAAYLTGAWESVGTAVGNLAPDSAAVLIFAIVVFAVFAGLDRLTLGRLKPAVTGNRISRKK